MATAYATLRGKQYIEKGLFGEPDTPETIIFDEESSSSEKKEIKAATLVKLLERVTFEEYADPTFMNQILLTYRSFTNSRELLRLLMLRFNTAMPKNVPPEEKDKYESKAKNIRLRVVNFLISWMKQHGRDLVEDSEIVTTLTKFFNDHNSEYPAMANQMKKLIERRGELGNTNVTFDASPKSYVPKKSSFLEFHPEEIARQITIIEFELFTNIKSWEFFNQSWTKSNKATAAPNLTKLLRHFNTMTSWVATEIVNEKTSKGRRDIIIKFIEVGEKCLNLHNFNAVFEIIGGLASVAVYRLKKTWESVPDKYIEILDQLRQLMTTESNHAKLRQLTAASSPPIIPYLGLYLNDLTYIEDGNPNVFDGKINWKKRKRITKVLEEILKAQQQPFNFAPVPIIRDYILKGQTSCLDIDLQYKLSLELESRDGKKKSSKSHHREASIDSDETSKPEEIDMQYLPGYKFYEKDSDSNIIVVKSENAPDIIKAGTIPKLIERLANEKYADPSFLDTFLLTFRTFLTPNELLDLLTMRFNIPPPINVSAEILQEFKMNYEAPIQIRVVNVLKHWIDEFFEEDFSNNQLFDKLLQFLDHISEVSKQFARRCQAMKEIVSSKATLDRLRDVKMDTDSSSPSPNASLLDYTAEQIAQQLCLINHSAVKQINNLEFLQYRLPDIFTSDEERKENEAFNQEHCFHIVAVTSRFLKFVDFVSSQILKYEDKKERTKILELFIMTAQKCYELRDFQSLVAIIEGVSFDYILNLKSTWKNLSMHATNCFVSLYEMTSYRENFKNLRQEMQNAISPTIPFIGLLLQDLKELKEQHPDTIEPLGLINFVKRKKLADQIYRYKEYWKDPYSVEPIPILQELLTNNLTTLKYSERVSISEKFQKIDGDDSILDDFLGIKKRVSFSPGDDPRNSTSPRSSLNRGSLRSEDGSFIDST